MDLVTLASYLFDTGGNVAVKEQGAESAGHLFEKICLWLVPLAGATISSGDCVALGRGEMRTPLGNLKLPPMNTLSYDWKREENLVADVFYQPLITNLESGFAFCVLTQADGSFMLIVLRVTIAETHAIKGNDLHDIFKAFPLAIREHITRSITRSILLFVTPFGGKLNSLQSFHSQPSEVAIEWPDCVRYIEQWVYRHRLVQANTI